MFVGDGALDHNLALAQKSAQCAARFIACLIITPAVKVGGYVTS